MTDLICRKSMTRCLTPGMCSPHGGCQTPETASAFRSLLAERNSLAFLLKRFVDGEHDQEESQSERHLHHDEAETLLAYLGGEVQGHTLVPDEILRAEHEKKKALIAENDALTAKTETYCTYGGEGSEHTYYGNQAAIAALTQLVIEVEALRKDADRYRWIRDKSEAVHQFYLSVPLWFTGVRFRAQDVDEAIDAMSKGE